MNNFKQNLADFKKICKGKILYVYSNNFSYK